MELHAYEEMAQSLDTSLLSGMTGEAQQGFRPTTVFPPVTPPGMAYVPFQQWGDVYRAEQGFPRGTMFPVLDFPFDPNGGDCTK